MSSLSRPVQKGNTAYTRKPAPGLSDFEMFPSLGKTKNGFVIHITETPPPPPGPPHAISKSQDTAEQTSRQKPQPPPLAIPPKAYISDNQQLATHPSPPSTLPPRSRAASPTQVTLPRSDTNTPILVRNNSGRTPIMRSMFPRYDHNKPFTAQQYRPDIDAVPGLASAIAVAGTSSYNAPSYSQQANIRPSSAYLRSERDKQQAADMKESPFRSAETTEHKPTLSSLEQLLDVWDIANGQTASKAVADTYVLELSCEDLTLGREIITLNASTSDPLYTLEASHSAITISRTHPSRNHTPTIQIATSTLEKPTAIEPLVTSTFPKLAGLMALDHSSTVAVAHKLDRAASGDLQAEAVHRAQEREASMLLWDRDSNRYCLMHPTLLDSAPTTIPIEIVPDPSNPSTITFFAPETDNAPLLTLSLSSLTLTLHASAITALPSLYILDTLVSTLLSLLLHLHRSCVTPTPTPSPPLNHSNQPLFPPPPIHASDSSRSSSLRYNKRKSTRSHFSLFRSNNKSTTRSLHSAQTTYHERGGGEEEDDIELQQYLPPPHQRGSAETVIVGRRQKHHQPPKQLFSADDETLPKATRAALKLLYWAFEVLFWFMGVVVQVLAAGVVGAGKLVAKL